MSKRVRASWWVVVAASLLMAPLAFSQNTVLTLDSPGDNGSMGGIYVGPYGALQGPAQNQGTQVQIICDDFQHNVNMGDYWTVNATSVSSITDSTQGLVWSNQKAGGSYLGLGNIGVQQGYDAMAFLASELMGTKDKTTAGYLAYAIWAVFDAQGVYKWLVTENHDPSIWKTIQGYAVNALQGNYTAGEFAGWEVLTPSCGNSGNCSNQLPQEMFEYVPEGGTALMYLLLAGFACFGTMYFKSRRRHAPSEMV